MNDFNKLVGGAGDSNKKGNSNFNFDDAYN
jgi:hypothetical protein